MPDESPATPLAERRCVPCDAGTPPIPDDQVAPLLAELRGWRLGPEGKLTKDFEFEGFLPGVEMVGLIAPIAEAEGHHPDLHLTWGRLTVELLTHAIGGLSENDFVLAAKIDRALRAA